MVGRDEQLASVGVAPMIAALVRLRATWDGRCHLDAATARPTARATFAYPGFDPYRRASRPLDAIVDVLDPAAEPYDDTDDDLENDRILLDAKAPAGVRSEHGGLVVLRWVKDPADVAAVTDAAGEHDRWLSGLIDVIADDE